MEYTSPFASGATQAVFDDSPIAKHKSDNRIVKNISLHSGSLVSLWHEAGAELSAIEFSIEGLPVTKIAIYHPHKDTAFDAWLKQHTDDDYDMLIVEQGHQIDNIGKDLTIWSSTWHKQCLVIFDAVGLVSISALVDRCFEMSKNSEIKELFPDF